MGLKSEGEKNHTNTTKHLHTNASKHTSCVYKYKYTKHLHTITKKHLSTIFYYPWYRIGLM